MAVETATAAAVAAAVKAVASVAVGAAAAAASAAAAVAAAAAAAALVQGAAAAALLGPAVADSEPLRSVDVPVESPRACLPRIPCRIRSSSSRARQIPRPQPIRARVRSRHPHSAFRWHTSHMWQQTDYATLVCPRRRSPCRRRSSSSRVSHSLAQQPTRGLRQRHHPCSGHRKPSMHNQRQTDSAILRCPCSRLPRLLQLQKARPSPCCKSEGGPRGRASEGSAARPRAGRGERFQRTTYVVAIMSQ